MTDWAMIGELNGAIVDALGWHVITLPEPEIYQSDVPPPGFRIEAYFTIADAAGTPVMRAWQTEDLAWEHAPIPEYATDLNEAWSLFDKLPDECTPRIVRLLSPHGDQMGHSYKAGIIMHGSSGFLSENIEAEAETPALAICRVWLKWKEAQKEHSA